MSKLSPGKQNEVLQRAERSHEGIHRAYVVEVLEAIRAKVLVPAETFDKNRPSEKSKAAVETLIKLRKALMGEIAQATKTSDRFFAKDNTSASDAVPDDRRMTPQ